MHSSYATISLDLIDPPDPPLRSNIDPEGIRSLADSIRTIGLLSPLLVIKAGPRYRLAAGHRRLLALRLLERTQADCQILPEDHQLHLPASAAENMVRANLNPVDEAREINRLTNHHNLTTKQLAAALGRSETWVRGRLDMIHWPTEILHAIRQEQITVGVGRELAAIDDEPARRHFLDHAIDSGAAVQVVRRWRLENETIPFSPNGTAEGASGAGPCSDSFIPHTQCELCGDLHPVVDLVYTKLCGACRAGMEIAKRDAGGASPAPAP